MELPFEHIDVRGDRWVIREDSESNPRRPTVMLERWLSRPPAPLGPPMEWNQMTQDVHNIMKLADKLREHVGEDAHDDEPDDYLIVPVSLLRAMGVDVSKIPTPSEDE